MSLTQNTRRDEVPARSPKPSQVIAARERSRMTVEAAARLIHASATSWRSWEAGDKPMHAGLFDLFLRKSDELRGAAHQLGRPTVPITMLDPVTSETITAGFGWSLARAESGGAHLELLLTPAGHVGIIYGTSSYGHASRWLSSPTAAARWIDENLRTVLPADLIESVLVTARARYAFFDDPPPRRISPVLIDRRGGRVHVVRELPPGGRLTRGMAPGFDPGAYVPLFIEADSLDGIHRYRIYAEGMMQSVPRVDRSGIVSTDVDARILCELLDEFEASDMLATPSTHPVIRLGGDDHD